jgi:NADPH:quinone reductase-like Zn-dependent oxidoreductase
VYGYDLEGAGHVDVVLDALGGSSLRDSYRRLRAGGRLVTYGAATLVTGDHRNLVRVAPRALRMIRGFSALSLVEDSRGVIGLNMLRLWDQEGSLRPWLEPMSPWFADGTLRPTVAAEISFERAADAHRLLGDRANVGKVVLVP